MLFYGSAKKGVDRRWFMILCLLGSIFIPQNLLSQPGEYEIKAEFLYNFTQFVTWPESAFTGKNSPFQICVVGEDPFGHILEDAVLSEKVRSHPIVVHRIQDPETMSECHIVFVSQRCPFSVEEIQWVTNDHAVLLTGETPDFAGQGGVIGFRNQDGKIRLQINLHSARQANLTISSKLLKLSEVIEQ